MQLIRIFILTPQVGIINDLGQHGINQSTVSENYPRSQLRQKGALGARSLEAPCSNLLVANPQTGSSSEELIAWAGQSQVLAQSVALVGAPENSPALKLRHDLVHEIQQATG